jgi:hypothetical protein
LRTLRKKKEKEKTSIFIQNGEVGTAASGHASQKRDSSMAKSSFDSF